MPNFRQRMSERVLPALHLFGIHSFLFVLIGADRKLWCIEYRSRVVLFFFAVGIVSYRSHHVKDIELDVRSISVTVEEVEVDFRPMPVALRIPKSINVRYPSLFRIPKSIVVRHPSPLRRSKSFLVRRPSV